MPRKQQGAVGQSENIGIVPGGYFDGLLLEPAPEVICCACRKSWDDPGCQESTTGEMYHREGVFKGSPEYEALMADQKETETCGEGMCWAASLSAVVDHWKAEVKKLRDRLYAVDAGDRAYIQTLLADREHAQECHREAVALAERYREEMDRYRTALQRIVQANDPSAGGLYCNFCEAANIAEEALGV